MDQTAQNKIEKRQQLQYKLRVLSLLFVLCILPILLISGFALWINSLPNAMQYWQYVGVSLPILFNIYLLTIPLRGWLHLRRPRTGNAAKDRICPHCNHFLQEFAYRIAQITGRCNRCGKSLPGFPTERRREFIKRFPPKPPTETRSQYLQRRKQATSIRSMGKRGWLFMFWLVGLPVLFLAIALIVDGKHNKKNDPVLSGAIILFVAVYFTGFYFFHRSLKKNGPARKSDMPFLQCEF